MNRLLYVAALICATVGVGARAEESSEGAMSQCPNLNAVYQLRGTQLSGPELGDKFGPSLTLHVFRGYRIHKPGARPESVRLTLLNSSLVSVTVLDGSKTALTEDQVTGECKNGSFIFTSTSTGGSEGYHGTSTWVVRLASGANESLAANVQTSSKGKDFGVFPHSDEAARVFSFNRAEQ